MRNRSNSPTKSRNEASTVFKSGRRNKISRGTGNVLLRNARRAGLQLKRTFAKRHSKDSEAVLQTLQKGFMDWCTANLKTRPSYSVMKSYSDAFGYAFRQTGKGQARALIPMYLKGRAAAVVCARSEGDRLKAVLMQLERLPLEEILVILNGCEDHSYQIARQHERCTVVYFKKPLGHDVGRSIGASLTAADIILFTDGDMVISAEELAPFLYAVDSGVDVALNKLDPYLQVYYRQDEVTRVKSFLNTVLGREDLRANSLTAVPHAVSSRCIAGIGASALTVPPKALMLAITQGYQVAAVHTINVITRNRSRKNNTGPNNAVAELIVGDHIEALQKLFEQPGYEGLKLAQMRSEVARRRNSR